MKIILIWIFAVLAILQVQAQEPDPPMEKASSPLRQYLPALEALKMKIDSQR